MNDKSMKAPAQSVTLVKPAVSGLTTIDFHQLADVPPALTWFANIDNPQTRRAYQNDVEEFVRFIGLEDPHAFRQITRAHVLAWRRDLEQRALGGATIRRKLSALSSLFDALCEANAVHGNPVEGVKRPKITSQEGVTPAIGDHQARELLAAPDGVTLRGLRDRAILATLLYHGLRRAELCALRQADVQERRGVRHLQVHGKGSKIRHVPLHPAAAGAIAAYLEADGRGDDKGPLFRPVSNNARGTGRSITPDGVYKVLTSYAGKMGIDVAGFGPHALRATAATNALENGADIAKVQTWLGHANIATTRRYDRRQERAEDSPTFKVTY
jgi:integrase/recombinase XerD